MSTKSNEKKNSGKGQNGNTPQTTQNNAESMEDIFDLKQPQTFSKEVKPVKLTDAWGKQKK